MSDDKIPQEIKTKGSLRAVVFMHQGLVTRVAIDHPLSIDVVVADDREWPSEAFLTREISDREQHEVNINESSEEFPGAKTGLFVNQVKGSYEPNNVSEVHEQLESWRFYNSDNEDDINELYIGGND